MTIKKGNSFDSNGKTITFYSYKGGVGRSMALVNIACLMAKEGKKILLIDWDLEAPGLHTFFKKSANRENLGLVDFVSDTIEHFNSGDDYNDDAYEKFLSKNLASYVQENIQIQDSEYQLDIMTAGKFGIEYIAKLNAIDWLGFYKNAPSFFRMFSQHLEKEYDYILIDSRTGLSDTGGICTLLMPQILVLVFALNNQNIKGVLDVGRQSIDYRFNSNDYRDLTVLPLPSRIDDQNSKDLEEWMRHYTKSFEDLLQSSYMLDECLLENYFNIAKIPYKPIHAYGENIPTLNENSDNDFFISYHYAQFYDLIKDESPIYEILSKSDIEINRKQSNFYFAKGVEYLYKSNFESSIVEFEKSAALNHNNDAAFNNWGNALGQLADTKDGKEAEELYKQAIDLFEKSIDVESDNSEAFNNWGNALGHLAKTKDGKKSDELYKQAFEKYQNAIDINPYDHKAFYNWGNQIGNLAETKEGKEVENLYKKAFEKYQNAIDINPDYHEAYNNWGNALGNLAEAKKEKEAEVLYKQAFDKYQKAIDIKSDKYISYNNWGVDLGNLAEIKNGKEAEDLYKASIDKYQKALDIKPDYYEVLYNWGFSLKNLAKIKDGKEADELNKQAFDKLQKSVEYDGRSYNLSCIYALKGEKENALKYLEISLSKDEITVEYVEKDDDWKNYLKDKKFIKLLKKYRK